MAQCEEDLISYLKVGGLILKMGEDPFWTSKEKNILKKKCIYIIKHK